MKIIIFSALTVLTSFSAMATAPSAPKYSPIMIAQITQTHEPAKTDRTIGVCELVENPLRYTSINGIGPIGDAQFYFESIEHRQISITGVVTVLQNPKHGTLEPRSDAPGGYLYLPEVDYFGPDRATYLVEVDGKKIKVEYFFKVLQGVADDYTEEQFKNLCPNGNYWKISSIDLHPSDISLTYHSRGTR